MVDSLEINWSKKANHNPNKGYPNSKLRNNVKFLSSHFQLLGNIQMKISSGILKMNWLNKNMWQCWRTLSKIGIWVSKWNTDTLLAKSMVRGSAFTFPSSSRHRSLNSLPSMTRKSSLGFRMPHFEAIERAVFTLSPVTIRTVMPECWHFLMASGTWNSQWIIITWCSIATNNNNNRERERERERES